MATGTDSFMGKAMPILGNTTLTGETVGDVILTVTAPTAQTADIMVLGDLNSSASNALKIKLSSTGAIAATAALNANAILVQGSSKSAINCLLMYDSVGASGSATVSTATAFLGSNGTKAPTYLMTVGGTAAPSQGAATSNGFLTVGLTANTAATKAAWAGLKCLFGSKAYYVLAIPDTNLS